MLLLRRMVGATAHPSTMYGQSSVGDKGGETVLDVAVVYTTLYCTITTAVAICVLCASVSYMYCMGRHVHVYNI